MIVKKLESPIYYRKKRNALPGKGVDHHRSSKSKSFDQYLLEAFDGDVVQDGDRFSRNISDLTRDNLIRLSRM